MRCPKELSSKLKELGHLPTVYTSNDDLKLKFRDQLDKVLEKLQA